MKTFILILSLFCNIYFYAINVRMSDEFLVANADLENAISTIHSNFKKVEDKAIEVAKENNLLFISNQTLLTKHEELVTKMKELSKVNIEINTTLLEEKNKPLMSKAMEVGKTQWNYLVTDIKSNLHQFK
jgi:hypothetical protein